MKRESSPGPESSREIVGKALAAFGLTGELADVFGAWDALPEGVRAGCDIKAAGRGVVFIEAPSAAAMHGVFYNKPAIIEALNRRIGSKYVREIKIEIASSRKGKSGQK